MPHTVTTQKPAGTTSKLFNLTEGAHLPAMREYLRWVQFRFDDPLVAQYAALGYPVIYDLKTYKGTTIVGFPTIPEICTLGMGDALVTAPELPAAPAWSNRERSAKEKEVLGFYFSEHPLEPLRAELERLATHAVGDLPGAAHGTEVRIGGVLGELRGINTRSGRLMAAAMLEDLTGRIECTLFPDLYEQVRAWLAEDEIVVVSGRVEIRDDRGAKLVLTEVRRLDEARAVWSPTLHIEVAAESLSVRWLEEVDEVLSAHPGDSEVYLHLVLPNRERKTRRSRRYRVAGDSGVAEALRHRFPGVRAFWGKGVS
jgi:DNA polymerase III alpha subunit